MEWPAACYGVVTARVPEFRFLAHNPGARLMREALARHLRATLAVLDIGCGSGIGACHLAAAGAAGIVYVGIDPDADASAVAREVLESLPTGQLAGRVLCRSLAEHLADRPQRSDLILCDLALHECLDPADRHARNQVAAGVADLLKPGGRLVIGDPFLAPGTTPEEVAHLGRYKAGATGRARGGNPYLPLAEIARVWRDAGLELVEQHDAPISILARWGSLPFVRYGLWVFTTR